MKGAMLEYTKTVLQKVSLKKALKTLLPTELSELKRWLVEYVTDKPDLQPVLIQFT